MTDVKEDSETLNVLVNYFFIVLIIGIVGYAVHLTYLNIIRDPGGMIVVNC